MLNEFVKNGENGLFLNVFIRKTEVKISKNTFCENEFNGLLINGRYNNCIVQGNGKTTGNMKSGICVIRFNFINIWFCFINYLVLILIFYLQYMGLNLLLKLIFFFSKIDSK